MKLYSVVPYLLLVSFMTGPAASFTPQMGEVIAVSPYHGIAVAYQGAYEHSSVGHADQEAAFSQVSCLTGKQAWPWVFLNRMVGAVEGRGIRNKTPEFEFFQDITGMDVFDEFGARSAFTDVWRGALRTAKATGAPGVVLDLECYNNYDAYYVNYLSGVMGKDDESVRAALVKLGADMADMVAEEYPDAVVWSLFTALDRKRLRYEAKDRDYMSFSYIIIGMLDRCVEKGYRFKLVSGGEWGLAYCSRDTDHLKEKIKKREYAFSEALWKYPNLRLGGTIAPWVDSGMMDISFLGSSSDFLKCKVEDAAGFVPYFKELFRSYDYVWTYGAKSIGYNVYDRAASAVMDAALREALNSLCRPVEVLPDLRRIMDDD